MTLITLICANKTKVNTYLNFADVVWVNNLANLKTFKILVDPWYPQKFRFEWLRQWLRDKWQTASFSFILNLRKQDIKTIDKSAKLALNYPKKSFKIFLLLNNFMFPNPFFTAITKLLNFIFNYRWNIVLFLILYCDSVWCSVFCCTNSFKGTYISTN